MPARSTPRSGRLALLMGLVAAAVPGVAAAAEPFRVVALDTPGRSVGAEIVDLDGDGRGEVLEFAFDGQPPDETRTLRVYAADAEGGLALRFERALPADAAAFDLADLLPEPGSELVLLRRSGIEILSLREPDAPSLRWPVPGGVTLAVAGDERGLDRLRMVWTGFAAQPWIWVPVPGEAVALDAAGVVHAALRVGARANYYLPRRPGFAFAESDMQIYLDVPRLASGDVDGDGRSDVLSAMRHELRIFLRRPGGALPRDADRRIALRRVTAEDHVRGAGGVVVESGDLDGDGRVDLVIVSNSGGLTGAQSRTTVHRNRDGRFALEAPDADLETRSGWGSSELIDIDGDGRPELVRVVLPFSVLELVEMLVTRAIDAQVFVHRGDREHGVAPQPWLERKLSVPFSFETTRARGFVPTIGADIDGDGRRDLLTAGSGDRIEIWPGRAEAPFARRAARQRLDSTGRIHFGDIDGDGLDDAVIYDARSPERPLRVLLNSGALGGAKPRIGPRSSASGPRSERR